MSKKNIVCIGKSIQSFSELELTHEVESINVHCNEIKEITHLEGFNFLKHLDISSNKLTVISGLRNLMALCTLNLASNFITSVTGLDGLHGLKRINLSYNNLTSLAGLTDIHGHKRLEIVELHGNQLKDMGCMLPYLQGLPSIKHLVLKLENAENPICKCSDYRQKLLTGLPQLTSLDGGDMLEKTVNVELNNPESEFENVFSYFADAHGDYSVTNNVNLVPIQVPLQNIPSKTKEVPKKKLPEIVDIMAEKENCANCASVSSKGSKIHQKKSMPPTALSKLAMKKEKISLHKKKQRMKQLRCEEEIKPSTEVHCVNKETHLNVMKQLENETERRLKAEQASKKLTEIIIEKQSAASNEKVLQSLASDAADRLKTALIQEKENNQQLQNKLESKMKEVDKLRKEVSISLAKSSEHQQELKKEKNTHAFQTELENIKSKHNFATNEVSQLQNRVKQLEHLLVQKEEEHSVELQRVLDCHLRDERLQHQSEIMRAKEKVLSVEKKYKNLENEFREALCIENHRFIQLKLEHQALTEKTRDVENCLKETIEKEEKSKSMIRDMTAIIKEQKVKLTETTSSKEECLQQYKKRIQDLELECEDTKKKTVLVEMLRQEKSRLCSQITAMQSVVDGLKEERRQWGRELAQQGSSLAQDRGRLNLKIESLEAEVRSLQKNNERDLDSLRIKSKVVDDQTETILKLKEALSVKDKEIKMKLDENLIEQQQLQQVIDNLHQENGFVNEENVSLHQKIKNLKENLTNLNERYIDLQDNHGKLKVKWSDKVKVLGKLETQVKSVNETMLAREQKLKEEKDSAILATKNLLKKIEENYALHQDQLQALKISHDEETKRRQTDKEQEVQRLTKQVHEVENEMRAILEDSKKQKIMYEGKLNKIKQTFQDVSLNI